MVDVILILCAQNPKQRLFLHRWILFLIQTKSAIMDRKRSSEKGNLENGTKLLDGKENPALSKQMEAGLQRYVPGSFSFLPLVSSSFDRGKENRHFPLYVVDVQMIQNL